MDCAGFIAALVCGNEDTIAVFELHLLLLCACGEDYPLSTRQQGRAARRPSTFLTTCPQHDLPCSAGIITDGAYVAYGSAKDRTINTFTDATFVEMHLIKHEDRLTKTTKRKIETMLKEPGRFTLHDTTVPTDWIKMTHLAMSGQTFEAENVMHMVMHALERLPLLEDVFISSTDWLSEKCHGSSVKNALIVRSQLQLPKLKRMFMHDTNGACTPRFYWRRDGLDAIGKWVWEIFDSIAHMVEKLFLCDVSAAETDLFSKPSTVLGENYWHIAHRFQRFGDMPDVYLHSERDNIAVFVQYVPQLPNVRDIRRRKGYVSGGRFVPRRHSPSD